MKLPIKQPLIIGDIGTEREQGVCALYPFKNSDGEHLCRIVMGLKPQEYLKKYGRVNLCGGRWNTKKARGRAVDVMLKRRRLLILLGPKVCGIFGLKYAPFTFGMVAGVSAFILPRASAKDRAWKIRGIYSDVQVTLADCDARMERESATR